MFLQVFTFQITSCAIRLEVISAERMSETCHRPLCFPINETSVIRQRLHDCRRELEVLNRIIKCNMGRVKYLDGEEQFLKGCYDENQRWIELILEIP